MALDHTWSDRAHPPPAELLRTRERDPEAHSEHPRRGRAAVVGRVVGHRARTARDPRRDAPVLSSRDLSSRDLSSRDLSSRDLSSRDLSSRDLSSRDLDASLRLFGDVLGGAVGERSADHVTFPWPGGSLVVRAGGSAGVTGADLRGAPFPALRIGPATLSRLA